LEPLGLVAQETTLRLRLESGEIHERVLRVPEPTRSADILFRMLHTHLETVRTEAAVVGVGLSIDPGQPTQRQFNLFETVLRDPHQLQETLARLSALLGADRVGSPARQPGHQRDAFKLVPPDFENLPTGRTSRPALLRPVPWRRLRPAPAATVDTKGARPSSLRCAVADGKLKLTVGPCRASGQWWEPGAWAREDWDAETANGTVCRLSREADGWHVVGLLD
jgi:protein ImuB